MSEAAQTTQVPSFSAPPSSFPVPFPWPPPPVLMLHFLFSSSLASKFDPSHSPAEIRRALRLADVSDVETGPPLSCSPLPGHPDETNAALSELLADNTSLSTGAHAAYFNPYDALADPPRAGAPSAPSLGPQLSDFQQSFPPPCGSSPTKTHSAGTGTSTEPEDDDQFDLRWLRTKVDNFLDFPISFRRDQIESLLSSLANPADFRLRKALGLLLMALPREGEVDTETKESKTEKATTWSEVARLLDNICKGWPNPHIFCDVFDEDRAVLELTLGFFAFPAFPVRHRCDRFSYKDENKRNTMFVDIVVLDECRYIFEYFPVGPLLLDALVD